jgi:hypothetical protein
MQNFKILDSKTENTPMFKTDVHNDSQRTKCFMNCKSFISPGQVYIIFQLVENHRYGCKLNGHQLI